MRPSIRLRLNTQAYVNDSGQIFLADSGGIEVIADDESGIVAISGAVSISRQDPQAGSAEGTTAIGLAGSFSRNVVDASTEAFIARLDRLNEGDVTVEADRTGAGIFALSAGLAGTKQSAASGSQKNNGAALGGSVSFNTIDTDTRAFIQDANLTNSGEVAIAAADDSDLHAIGGGAGISIGGQLGFGAAVGVNEISTVTQSGLIGTDIDADGSVILDTSNRPKIHGVGLSAGAGQFGIAGTVGVNTVDFRTESLVADSDVIADGNIVLNTIDTSEIRSDAGGVSLGIKRAGQGQSQESAISGALGVAVAINSVGTDTGASVGSFVVDSSLDALGNVTLDTVSSPRIEALTLAGAVSISQNTGATATGALAGAAAGSQNTINTFVESSIRGSDVDARNVNVIALDQSSILADAGGLGVSLALSSGAGSTGAVGIGVGIALNEINGGTIALIDGSTVNADGDVKVSASALPPLGSFSIDALAIAGAASVGVGTGSGQSAQQQALPLSRPTTSTATHRRRSRTAR